MTQPPPIVPGAPQTPPPAYYPPQPTPPAGYYQQPYGPPPPQVVHKPGGLSSTAHAVHIIACLLTCGLWLPAYILFIAFAPARRTEVIVPYGADPRAVQAAYAQVAATPAENRAHNQAVLIFFSVFLGVLLLCGIGMYFSGR